MLQKQWISKQNQNQGWYVTIIFSKLLVSRGHPNCETVQRSYVTWSYERVKMGWMQATQLDRCEKWNSIADFTL